MPALSIIVPIFQVEAYLPQCLDSVFSQDFRDFEVIAVNDASPDGCLDILRRYEVADPRLKIIDLQRNQGLGGARNKGLDAATGTYVLFLDSDDSLVEGALSAMMDRARKTEAEVVLFGWTRDYENGVVRQGSGRRILTQAPERFTAEDYPAILHVLQVAWNKLIRRDFLNGLGLRFVDGLYEDTPFTYPLLVAARSITALSSPLIRYRQRPQAITGTAGLRHLQVLGQWDRAMAHVYELAADQPKVRSHLFAQMLQHCSIVLLQHKRIPRTSHSEFLRELRRLYRRYLPPEGYQALGPLERIQHSLLRFASPALMKGYWKFASFIRGQRHRASGQAG